MSIPITILDNRTQKEFNSNTDKLPLQKIIKTHGITVNTVCFILEEKLIIIRYNFNEAFNNHYSFRRYAYPIVELNDTVIDELIELIYDKLYIENILYLTLHKSTEYPEDILLDKVEYNGMTLLKYNDKYKPIFEISLKEEIIEIPDNIKELLLSEEPEFECPEEYKDIDWCKHLEFQPSQIVIDKFDDDDITIFSFFKDKLTILTHHFIRGNVLEYYKNNTKHNFLTIGKLSIDSIINENDRVIDKIQTDDAIIYRCKENTNTSMILKLI